MDFQDVPPTAFPRLLQLAVSQTFLHSIPFESYLLLCDSVQHVLLTRYAAIRVLTSVETSNQDAVFKLLEVLRAGDCESFDHNGSVFGLYVLGAYKDASQLVEKIFQDRNPSIWNEINKITTQSLISLAKQILHETLEDYLAETSAEATLSARIKSPGSIFAKLISTGELDLGQITRLDPRDLSSRPMPYDLIGAEIAVKNSNAEMFGEFSTSLKKYFALRDMPLTDQNVYGPNWMGRKSLAGIMRLDGEAVPFQLHGWDHSARRYEWLSYGNYKMNKLFYPLIPNWQSYL